MSINQFWYANGYVFWAFHLPAEVIERSRNAGRSDLLKKNKKNR